MVLALPPDVRPPRLPTFDYLGGHRYFVTCCTLGRRPLFEAQPVVDAAALQILQSARAYHFEVLAYVFMPDHVHLLVEGRREDANFRLFMRHWRKRTTMRRQATSGGVIWQDGYFERVLRGADGTQAAIDYILNNPVRAGLAQNPMDYPFAWSVTTHVS